MSDLSYYIKNCELTKKNLDSAEKSMRECINKAIKPVTFWQTPKGLAILSVTSFTLGLITYKELGKK